MTTYADYGYFSMRVSKDIISSQEQLDELVHKYMHEELDNMYNDVCSGNNPIIMTNYYCCCIISIHLHNIKFLFISEMQLNRRDFFCFLPTGNQCGKQEAQSLCTNRLIYVISPVECIVILLDSSSPNLPNKLELIKRHIMRNYKSQSSRVFIFFNSYVQYVYDNQSCN